MQIPLTGRLVASKKSAPLTPTEQEKLASYRKMFGSEAECAKSFNIGRSALNRILIVGSGHPDNIKKIRKKLIGIVNTN